MSVNNRTFNSFTFFRDFDFRTETVLLFHPQVTNFYALIRYLAFDTSDFLAEFGGLMGLLAGISVFSIIELFMTILKSFNIYQRKIEPKAVGVQKKTKPFLMNQKHLFYHLSKTLAKLLKVSNIHGVHYTSNKRLKTNERVFWFMTICMLMTFSCILVFNSAKNLQTNSVIIAIDEKIWNAEDVRLQLLKKSKSKT